MKPNPSPILLALELNRNHARAAYLAHRNGGNLTPAQERAFDLRNEALLLLLTAAELEFSAVHKLESLLEHERAVISD